MEQQGRYDQSQMRFHMTSEEQSSGIVTSEPGSRYLAPRCKSGEANSFNHGPWEEYRNRLKGKHRPQRTARFQPDQGDRGGVLEVRVQAV